MKPSPTLPQKPLRVLRPPPQRTLVPSRSTCSRSRQPVSKRAAPFVRHICHASSLRAQQALYVCQCVLVHVCVCVRERERENLSVCLSVHTRPVLFSPPSSHQQVYRYAYIHLTTHTHTHTQTNTHTHTHTHTERERERERARASESTGRACAPVLSVSAAPTPLSSARTPATQYETPLSLIACQHSCARSRLCDTHADLAKTCLRNFDRVCTHTGSRIMRAQRF